MWAAITLSPGSLADFVIPGEDIFAIAPGRIRDVRVERAFLGGRQVWPAN